MGTTIRTQLFIRCPPEAIADVILDPALATEWTSDLERFEVVSGRPGEPGSMARLHYLQSGRRYVMTDTLIEAVPNCRYLSRVSGDALAAEVETTLTPSSDGTHLRIRWSGTGRSLLLRLVLPFMRRAIARQARADMLKLKQLVEARQGVAA
jgi:hypothetical protein